MGSTKFVRQLLLDYARSKPGFEQRIAKELFDQTDGADLWAFRTALVVFFLVVPQKHKAVLASAVQVITDNWDSNFLNPITFAYRIN